MYTRILNKFFARRGQKHRIIFFLSKNSVIISEMIEDTSTCSLTDIVSDDHFRNDQRKA